MEFNSSQDDFSEADFSMCEDSSKPESELKSCAASLLADTANISAALSDVSLKDDSIIPWMAIAKVRNPLGLKLLIESNTDNSSTNDTDWINATPEDSSLCSPTSTISGSNGSVDDSGFSSDESSHPPTPEKNCKLSRTKSLRSSLRSPTRSASNKTVRFADSLGLDLEQKTYFDCEDSRDYNFAPSFSIFSPISASRVQPPAAVLCATNFPNRSEAETSHLARTQCVCLSVYDVVETNVTGTVNVLNLACEKEVSIRYTTDNWLSHSETRAIYSRPVGDDGAVDAFSFFLSLPRDLPVGANCQFCVRYQVSGTTYWDSNNGDNYVITCVDPPSEDAPSKSVLKQSQANRPAWGAARHSAFVSSATRNKRYGAEKEREKCDYLPFPPAVNNRPSRISGWGRSGYSYDDEMGFY